MRRPSLSLEVAIGSLSLNTNIIYIIDIRNHEAPGPVASERRASWSQRVHRPPDGLREIARRAAREAERQALDDVLHRLDWNRAGASRILRVSEKTLLQKIVDCGLTPPGRQSVIPRAGRASR